MDLPTPRELDLETELRKRDAQVAELTVRFPGADCHALFVVLIDSVLSCLG